jgi:very-short-patch-repair endonuclease
MRAVVVCGRVARVRVERVLERLGGVAETAELRQHVSRARIRVAVRRGRIVRDVRGRYALPGADEALRAANRLSGVLWLDSAAAHHGWKLKHRPSAPALAVPRNRKLAPERRAGVRVAYVDLPASDLEGRVTAKVRTVLDCASRLPFDEALAIADSALRARDVDRAALLRAARQMPDRYRTRCLRVATEADPRADNPFESVLRAIALDVPGLQVKPQQWIGRLGRPDLLDPVLRLAVEAESFEFHGARRLLKRDCERYNAFVLDGWWVVRFAWEHVMFQPDYVDRVLRGMVALLGRGPGRRALAAPGERLSA